MNEVPCRLRGFPHDWRHLEATVEYVNPDDPEYPALEVTDVWYCTRCRRIEKTTRDDET